MQVKQFLKLIKSWKLDDQFIEDIVKGWMWFEQIETTLSSQECVDEFNSRLSKQDLPSKTPDEPKESSSLMKQFISIFNDV